MFLHQNLIKIGPGEPEICAIQWGARFSLISPDISQFVALFLSLQNSLNSQKYFLDALSNDPEAQIYHPEALSPHPGVPSAHPETPSDHPEAPIDHSESPK